MSLKKALRLFSSMSLALVLLGLIALACVAGGVIPQNGLPAQYEALYGPGWAAALQALQLHRVFSALWFQALVVLLMINLCLCSILRFPQTLRQMRRGYTLDRRLQTEAAPLAELPADRADAYFKAMGFPRWQTSPREDGAWRYAARRKIGLWGSWVSHLGMLVIAVAFALGQWLMFEGSVYGVPGQTLPLADTSLTITINAFDILFRADDTVEQYVADLTVRDEAAGTSVSGRAMVNQPLNAYGKHFYQNSTGWAATLATYVGDELLDTRPFFAGESLDLQEISAEALPLALVFHALYPDYIQGPDGPRTRSPQLNNPAALFSLYYQGKLVDMNVAGMGYDIKVADTRFVLSAPRPYTLIQVVGDPAIPLATAGGGLMLVGLFLAFYWRPEELWAKVEGQKATVWGRSPRGAQLFEDRARAALKAIEEDV